eukprot:SAG31_NODE_28_length_32713_cov_39.100509_4_plen_388_part_00
MISCAERKLAQGIHLSICTLTPAQLRSAAMVSYGRPAARRASPAYALFHYANWGGDVYCYFDMHKVLYRAGTLGLRGSGCRPPPPPLPARARRRRWATHPTTYLPAIHSYPPTRPRANTDTPQSTSTMSQAAMDAIISGKTSEERLPNCETMAKFIIDGGAAAWKAEDFGTKLVEMMGMKKKPGALEGACIVLKLIAEQNYKPVEPYILPIFLQVLDLCGDKKRFIGDAAAQTCKAIIDKINPYAARKVVPILFDAMTDDYKWQTHCAALNCLGYLCLASAEQVSLLMYLIVPKVAAMMWEMKQDVKDTATQCMTDVCACIDNNDIQGFIPLLVKTIANPEEVPETVHQLAATTFVQTVNSAAMSIVEPLLVRAFTEKSTAIKRLCQ